MFLWCDDSADGGDAEHCVVCNVIQVRQRGRWRVYV